jgi:hypothetical protein
MRRSVVFALLFAAPAVRAADPPALTLSFEAPHWLVIHAPHLPGKEIRVNYLEAYCRARSTDADWGKHTVIPHRTELLSVSGDRKTLRLRDALSDGVTVEHTITAKDDAVDFRLTAHNPTARRSEAHWAQPCVRLAGFTGYDPGGRNIDDYLPRCFVFLNGKLTRLPDVKPWATDARYTPGQVWCPRGVPRTDVNPRPLSPLVPDNGLIGAFSRDEMWVYATAWEPYQELFQGVARCLHSDFRLGGLMPGESKPIRGKIYLVTNDVPALLKRYAADFPEQQPPTPVTSLANAAVRYSVPTKEYVTLRRGGVEAVVVDNRRGSDATLPGHAEGYSGIGSLTHAKQARNLFVPAYAGLNFEHIHDSTVQPRDVLFEPRRAPMELRIVGEHAAELYQKPTPHWGLEFCTRYELTPEGIIEMTFECIPRRETFKNGYVGLFWASYIHRPESLDIHFRGVNEGSDQPSEWKRGVTPAHGARATHRPAGDGRAFAHATAFPLELPFGFSDFRYTDPWYFGVCRGMAFVPVFRDRDLVWFSQSPSGGGKDCPAWDFQWFIPQPRVGELYQLKLRVAYLPLDRPGDATSARDQVQRAVTGLLPK